jgi:sulfur-oxidizing protein SoxZ
MSTAMIYLPRRAAKAGDIVTIKAMISHPMETGHRRTERGEPIARDIIRHFSCLYAGEEVFSADLFPAISANPFLAFTTVATRTAPLTFIWKGDNGFEHRETATLVVEG